jgi:hypothetical protein
MMTSRQTFPLALALSVGIVSASCGREVSGPVKPTPLPAGAFKASWVSNDIAPVLARGKTARVHVTVKNVSEFEWPDRRGPTKTGSGAVRLSHRWLLPGTPIISLEGFTPREELAAPVKPGESTTFTLDITAPASPGDYTLQFDLLQEFVAFFGDKGSPRLIIPVKVQ